MMWLADVVRRIRPAPLASAIGRLTGLSRRRSVRTEWGTFFLNPISNLGTQILRGEFEPSMRAVIEKYVFPGAVFIDLGANEGYFTVLGSRLAGVQGSVIAVEPQSRLQTVIQRNLELNGCSNVRVANVALCARTEQVYLELTPEIMSGGTSLFRSTKYPLPREAVQGLTLENFFRTYQIGGCDLMKVDVEGAEYDIFMAAESLLRSGVIRNIALDIHDSILAARGLSGDALHRWMVTCGYRLDSSTTNRVYRFGESA
jgi:FkbM family methyltransferase